MSINLCFPLLTVVPNVAFIYRGIYLFLNINLYVKLLTFVCAATSSFWYIIQLGAVGAQIVCVVTNFTWWAFRSLPLIWYIHIVMYSFHHRWSWPRAHELLNVSSLVYISYQNQIDVYIAHRVSFYRTDALLCRTSPCIDTNVLL